ncbi:FGGY-family carbohydrate kinase [Cryobacterium sp. PH29-G1]|uniref:FGGY-family carbohydrate kinase n=1 Tax=Cryobacterium sp. PH29-G1 TaxID=3046211 RepID=UPI0024BAA1D2|nr:FGGY-family carbohydrate kinase [Cryobacterium sp. PH29-G1]MDJ0350788.1 FGGY-family carbohydrate kinase [Cryobacterium sp. PH29-G1]
MTTPTGLILGLDIGTSSTKGVLVDLGGHIVATATRAHEPSRPHPGQVEMDADVWWREFGEIARELTESASAAILAVGVSGMGPCVLLTDEEFHPLRPAILYGVDTRAGQQIERLNEKLGAEAILQRCGSMLSSQAAGPKLAWIAEHEPQVWERARHLFMPASWLAFNLTGAYVLDHQSASQTTPLYDTLALDWYAPWADQLRGSIELPTLKWPGDAAGTVTRAAAAETGLPEGIPVIVGTIDAWTEAVSVGAQHPGDLMLMYGTTLFLVNTSATRCLHPALWGTVGAFEGTYNFAAGMATSGAITAWLKNLFGDVDYPVLLAEAAASPPGANGLLMLPYFAGERTPINDPDARGVIVGLTLSHTRGDLYRAALEATAFGIRHNIEQMRAAGATIDRIVAVGGGTQGGLWTQIVSDVTGLVQEITTTSIGASFGAAFLAAGLVGATPLGGTPLGATSIEAWNPVSHRITPNALTTERYDALFASYLQLYPQTKALAHELAEVQRGS